MAVVLTDAQIQSLILAPKELPGAYMEVLGRMTERRKHRRSELEVATAAGRFFIKLRENVLNAFCFSAILGYRLESTTRIFRLRRYNGSHRHRNPIERETLDGFHIHMATERYQALGGDEETFAEPRTAIRP